MSDKVEKTKKGFAAMDPALRQELASRGGKSVHAMGKAHQYTKEEARAAGLKGQQVIAAKERVLVALHSGKLFAAPDFALARAALHREELIEGGLADFTAVALTEAGRAKAAILVERRKALAASKRP